MTRKILLLLVVLISFTILLPYLTRHAPDEAKRRDLTVRSVTDTDHPSPYQLLAKNISVDSGAVDKVPWEKSRVFQETLRKNPTPTLMAAYRTVLPDPLPGEEYNVHLAARLLAGTTILPGQIFSQNQTLGPYNAWRGFKEGPTYIGSQLTTTTGGGVCKVASTLYNVVILCNLPVVERHAHSMPVPYVPYGQDATVSYGMKDFKFQNNTPFPILIWAQGVNNQLYIGFYGCKSPPRITWHHRVIQIRKAENVYRYNQGLPRGGEKVVLKGMDGALIRSWVSIKLDNGTTLTRQLGNSNYFPMPTVIERGAAMPAPPPPREEG